MRHRAMTASARILEEYSLEHQRADLLAFFGWLFSRDGAGASTQTLAKRGSGQIRDQLAQPPTKERSRPERHASVRGNELA